MKIRIQQYRPGSRSARELSRALGVLRLTPRREAREARDAKFIINWGSTKEVPYATGYINHPQSVERASDKLAAFAAFTEAQVPTVEWTVDNGEAQSWLEDGHTVVARTLLRANSGRGIVVVEPNDVLPPAPLYTKYFKKRDEYRVHVGAGTILCVQQKRVRRDMADGERDFRVRNHNNGFVFCTGDVQPPVVVSDAAVAAVNALGLDFGAVDVGYNVHHDRAAVFEVNTAPGLEGSTPAKYREFFTRVKPELSGGAYARRRSA